MYDLTIVVPARNEMFLKNTIEDILANTEGNTNVIAILDGYWPVPPIQDNPRVILIHHTESIGQRAATNEAVRAAQSKYVMKIDAHCAFDKGFDIKMMKKMDDNWTMVPVMRNLWAFDWKCPDGHTRYQGPSGPCKQCGKETTMDIKWIAKSNPSCDSYCFDAVPHFQYFREYRDRPEYKEALKEGLTETMSLQGSCFMMTRYKYRKLNVCDESLGNWGNQGIEVACKTWLSGGKVVVNHDTWYAHMFRTQGGDFGFPWPAHGKEVEVTKSKVKDLLWNNQWNKQIHPISWLVEKFWPVPGWTEEELGRIKEG